MREIAASTGLSKAGLYYHFKDKEDLFLSVLTRNLENHTKIIRRLNESQGNSEQKLTQLILSFLATSSRDRAMGHLAEREIVHVSQEARAHFAKTYHNLFIQPIVEILKQGHSTGELNCPDPVFACRVFLGICWPFLMSNGHEFHAPLTSTTAQELVHVFLHGFAKSHTR